MPEPRLTRPAWMPRLGIRAQLLALLLPGMAALLAVDSWTDYHAYSATLSDAYDQVLLERVLAVQDSASVDAAGNFGLKPPFVAPSGLPAMPSERKYLYVGVAPLDGSGRLAGSERALAGVADLPASGSPQSVIADGRGGTIGFYEAPYHGQSVRVAVLARVVRDGLGGRHQLRILAAEETGRREQARQDLLRRELLAVVRMLLAMVLVVWIGLAWILKPLERLRELLRQRSAHQLAPLDASQVPNEVAPLVEAVNHHIADYRALLDQQGEFLADASHQLRTPLAIMMTQAGYALREQDPARMRETLHAIVAQLSRSRRLSDQLLAMAHASRAEEGEDAPVVDLNRIARDVVLQYLTLAHEKNLDLGWRDARGEDVADGAGGLGVPVRARSEELHEALANLLHNAIRHTPDGGRITVGVLVREGVAFAEVRDSGPGIPADRHEALFRRFQREVDGAQPSGAGEAPARGAGLGLAIARAYARRNGGDIVFAPGEPNAQGGRGLCAALRLPLAVAA